MPSYKEDQKAEKAGSSPSGSQASEDKSKPSGRASESGSSTNNGSSSASKTNGSPSKGDSKKANGSASKDKDKEKESSSSKHKASVKEVNLSTEERERLTKEYDTMKKELKDLIGKKRTLDRSLNSLEEQIYKFEGSYLDDTQNGNVIKGFDNYIKANPNKRRATITEHDRVFSLSSAVFLKVKMKEEENNS